MKDSRIIEAIDMLELSRSDADRIYQKITSPQSKNKYTVRKKTAIALVAAVLLVILSAGSVFAGKLIAHLILVREEHSEINMDGSKDIVISTYEAYSEDTFVPVEYDEAWLIQHSSETKLAIARDDGSCVVYGMNGNITSEQEMLIQFTSESNAISLPPYLPDGFGFDSSSYTLYLQPHEAEMSIYCNPPFSKNGYLYQNYQTPDSVKENVSSLTVTYRNADGESIVFSIDLFLGNNISINALPDAIVEKEAITGFDSAVLVSDSNHAICVASKLIEPIPYVPTNLIGLGEIVNENNQRLQNRIQYFDRIIYSVSSDTVSGDELIKVLSSVV